MLGGVVETITGRERRRRWSVQDKLRLVAGMAEPGARVRAVAARHGVCESLLFAWRRQVHDGVLRAPEMPVFVPVQVVGMLPAAPGLSRPELPAAVAPPHVPPAPVRPQGGLIEIELGDGRQVRVGADVNQAALRRVLAALRG